MNNIPNKNKSRLQELEEQLVFCELSGFGMKARLVRGSIHALRISKEQEKIYIPTFLGADDVTS